MARPTEAVNRVGNWEKIDGENEKMK
ncbi:hypothetical protein CCACVL1_30421 [Corchorus capsularis]|uniref:Uncharacterized protein n=1 Tax=Corchorus capsularis TaxID=210143 RepID=A0A1R3FX70_COCAP|nr:hypothetical protein CCACVL1_30421 [Corchorus capsularis]